jgi:prophage regulatory protein
MEQCADQAERDRLIALNEVMHLVGLRRTSIYKMIGEQRFPRPVKIGERTSRWIEREIRAWQLAQISLRDDGAHNR